LTQWQIFTFFDLIPWDSLMLWAWILVCGRFMNFRNDRKILTLLTFGCPSYHKNVIAALFQKIHHRNRFKNLCPNCLLKKNFFVKFNKQFVDHSLIWKLGGYTSMMHNSVRDSWGIGWEVSTNVQIEPTLLPITENKSERKVITADNARCDTLARGLWNSCEKTFFDITITHPTSQAYSVKSLLQIYQQHEKEDNYTYIRTLRFALLGTPLLQYKAAKANRAMFTSKIMDCHFNLIPKIAILWSKIMENYVNAMTPTLDVQ